MTMPHLLNCPHSGEGWCLRCVGELHGRLVAAQDRLFKARESLDVIERMTSDPAGMAPDLVGYPDRYKQLTVIIEAEAHRGLKSSQLFGNSE